jgi:predicted transposase YdaD
MTYREKGRKGGREEGREEGKTFTTLAPALNNI